MLRINKAEDQALRLAMRLATEGGQLTLSELATREGLPEPTVAKLLSQLRREGVVVAARGRNGGYELAAPPAMITVARVLSSVDTLPMPYRCSVDTGQQGACPRESDCGLRSVWNHLQAQVDRLLVSTSLADLLQLEREVDAHLARLWPVQLTASGES